ncbi:hypothetical protein AAHA92_14576 [Salvia divinorum]|uniref:Uncharacterized protein n=1 Tax=Salvia divinorum TaxID=28513 RepID=A0ABD1HBZ7_SALDI
MENINIAKIQKKNRIHYIVLRRRGEFTVAAAVALKSLSPKAAREVESTFGETCWQGVRRNVHVQRSREHCIGLNGLNVPDASLVPVKCTQDVLGATAFVYLIERCFEMLPKLLTKDIFLCVKM